MHEILSPVLIVTAIGLICALGLVIAARLLSVPVDERAAAIEEVLPGINCGACGYSGCEGYAKALSEGAPSLALCAPGGPETAAAIAGILGVRQEVFTRKVAVVCCMGSEEKTAPKMRYMGQKTCAAANRHFAGPGKCAYGCMGFGDCAAVCEYGAVTVCKGVAMIDPARCKACEMCVAACPKRLIAVLRERDALVVRCQNRDRGGETRLQCTAGCIGCMRCVKACGYDAVSVRDALAYIDDKKCVGCGACIAECPVGCITPVAPGIAAEAPGAAAL